MSLSWRETKGRVVICKDGIYLPLQTPEEAEALREVLEDILSNRREFYLKDSRRPP